MTFENIIHFRNFFFLFRQAVRCHNVEDEIITEPAMTDIDYSHTDPQQKSNNQARFYNLKGATLRGGDLLVDREGYSLLIQRRETITT